MSGGQLLLLMINTTPEPLTPEQRTLLSFLMDASSSATEETKQDRASWKYSLFEEALLDIGQEMKPLIRPRHIKRGRPNLCYANCQQLVLHSDTLKYVEGYAVAADDRISGCPIPHAWIIDDIDGRAYDPTWKDVGWYYLGIVFPTPLVDNIWRNRAKQNAEHEVSIFQGHYLDGQFLLRDGFPANS